MDASITPEDRYASESGTLAELSRLTTLAADRCAHGDVDGALDDIGQARRRWADASTAQRAAMEKELPGFLRRWARIHELLDRSDDARALLHESLEVSARIDVPASARSAAGHLAWIDAVTGRHGSAGRWIDRSGSADCRDVGADPDARVDVALARALRLADALQLDAAREVMGTLDVEHVEPESWAGVQFVIAHLSTPASAPAALDDLHDGESSRPIGRSRSGRALTLLTHARVRLHLLMGDTAGAIHASRNLPDWPALHVAHSAALLAADQNQAVLMIAQRTRPLIESHPRWRTKLAAVEGVALARIGAVETAREIATQLVEAVPRLGLYSSLTLLSADDIERLLGPSGADATGPLREQVLAHLSPRIVLRLSLLTRREREVLRLLRSGHSVDQMAALLFVSRSTIKSQVASIYRKLGVGSRDELITLTRSAPLDAG